MRKLFCRHKNSEVVCWHWTRAYDNNEIRLLEIQLKCNDCGKYYFKIMKDSNECNEFISKNENKRWSGTCTPVLKSKKGR